jgi:hypothetical protein
MCLAPKARHSTASPPQDGFAVVNLEQRPRIGGIQRGVSAESAIHSAFCIAEPESRFQRLFTRASKPWGDARRLKVT